MFKSSSPLSFISFIVCYKIYFFINPLFYRFFICTIRIFFNYLACKANLIETNPAQNLETPKHEKRMRLPEPAIYFTLFNGSKNWRSFLKTSIPNHKNNPGYPGATVLGIGYSPCSGVGSSSVLLSGSFSPSGSGIASSWTLSEGVSAGSVSLLVKDSNNITPYKA